MDRFSFVRFGLLLTGVGILFLFGPATVRTHGAFDAFLKIEGIDGGSKDAAHMNWIGLTHVVSGDLNGDAMADREASAPSVSELAVRKAGGTQAQTVGSATGGAGAGKATLATTAPPRDTASGMPTGKRVHKPLVIVKEVDKASPLLVQACASGKHFTTAEVDLSGQRYTLYDVVIAAVQKSSGGDRPTETLTLNFTKIEFKNLKQK